MKNIIILSLLLFLAGCMQYKYNPILCGNDICEKLEDIACPEDCNQEKVQRTLDLPQVDKKADLVITNVRLSNPNPKVGDVFSATVEVINIGNKNDTVLIITMK